MRENEKEDERIQVLGMTGQREKVINTGARNGGTEGKGYQYPKIHNKQT